MTWTRVADSLNWSIGHSGKGYLLQDGTLKTWNVDPFNPLDHYTVLQRNNEQYPSALNFEIDPDGGVVTKEPTTKVQAIVNQDPRLYDAGQRPIFEDDFNLDNFEPTPQGKGGPDFNFIMSAWDWGDRAYHFHPYTGLPCTCGWGQSKQKRTSSFHEASQYIRQVRNQNQKVFRDERGQKFLNSLEKLIEEYPDAEAMVPWIVNQYKKGHFISPYAGDDRIFHWNQGQQSLSDFIAHRTDPEYEMDPSHSLLAYGRNKAFEEFNRREDAGEPRMTSDEMRALVDEYNTKTPREWVDLAVQHHSLPYQQQAATPALRDLYRGFDQTQPRMTYWQNWMNAGQHPTRRGVNIMEHDPHSVEEMAMAHQRAMIEAQKKQLWLERYGPKSFGPPDKIYDDLWRSDVPVEEHYPEPLHTFEGPAIPGQMYFPGLENPLDKYKGWHIIKLTPRQAEGDSAALGHCIGDYENQNYHYNIAKGNINAYSLRDKEGYPHVTWHFNPGDEDIGHMQGQSHPIKDEYRQLISKFHQAYGMPDEEGVENHDLEDRPDQYDDEINVSVNDMDDFVRYEESPSEFAESQNYDANIGPDTRIEADTDWYDVARDYLSGSHGSRMVNRFFSALADNYWAANQIHSVLADLITDGVDENSREMYELWNENVSPNLQLDIPIPEANGVDEYNEAMDEYNGAEPNFDAIARDYLKYPEHYERSGDYDTFHEHLYGNDHEQEMSDALHQRMDWNNPDYVQAINYWNQHWNEKRPEMMVHKEPPYVPEVDPNQAQMFNPNLYNETPEYQPYPMPEENYRGYSQYPLPGEGETAMRWGSTLWEWDSGVNDPLRNWEGLSPMKPIIGTDPQRPYQPRNEVEEIYAMIGDAAEAGDYERARWLYQFLPAEMQPARQASVPEQSILTPAVELQEWLSDLGGEPEAPSIHHPSIEDTIVSPSVSPSDALSYYPPAHVPTEIKQSAAEDYEVTHFPDLVCNGYGCLDANTGLDHYKSLHPGQGSIWYCPNCGQSHHLRGIPTTGDPYVDSLIYQGQSNHEQSRALLEPDHELEAYEQEHYEPEPEPEPEEWQEPEPQERRPIPPEHAQMDLHCADCGRPLVGQEGYAQEPNTNNFFCMPCVEQRIAQEQDQEHLGHVIYSWDSPITQADATDDALGKSPALITQPHGDPDYLHDQFCPNCNQIHRPDQPCPDTSVRQYQQQEREWYGRDPNQIHSPDPNNHSEYPAHQPVSHTASVDPHLNERLEEMQEAIVRLASLQSPEEKKPRKLVIKRDEHGRMQSIEEV